MWSEAGRCVVSEGRQAGVCGRVSAVFRVIRDAVDDRGDRQFADTDAMNRHEHREPASSTPSIITAHSPHTHS